MSSPLALLTAPSAARVFFGYRADHLRDRSGDSNETRAKNRSEFLSELGGTFMPGTPLMQAPLGLMAYLPVVIDPDAQSGFPDEVALIIYVSREVYDSTRTTSLSRRMYTRAHHAVFDMKAAVAGFPGTIVAPTTVQTTAAGPVDIWHVYPHLSDWQDGEARFLLIRTDAEDFRSALRERTSQISTSLAASGCDQLIVACAERFACLWFHATERSAAIDVASVIGDALIVRDLEYQGKIVRGDNEAGETITGASAFNWRFSRDLRYF